MRPYDDSRRISGLIGGVLLLLVGSLFLLQNLSGLEVGRLGDYWPLLLVWFGLSRVLGPGRGRHFASGLAILILGVVFQLDRLGLLKTSLRDLWPLLFVVAGASLIADSFLARRRLSEPIPPGSASEPGGRP